MNEQTTQTSYAGFWRRFVAIIIDAIILNIAFYIIGAIFGVPYGMPGRSASTAGFFSGFNLVTTIIAWLYFVLMESSTKQATIGKMALGIKVTDMDGNRISFGRATGRHFAKIISAIILLIGFIMAGFTEKKQALHDMIAQCLVVKK